MDIAERVKAIVVEKLNVDASRVVENARFFDDLGADSLDLFELVIKLEEEFDITIPEEDSQKIITVQSAIDYILSHQKQV